MTGPRSSRNTHERNLERNLEAFESRASRPRWSELRPAQELDVASRLARDAAQREAARRGRGPVGQPNGSTH